ncbi:hypothetical protein DFH28DRAFT_950767 [Melampsora americana]|nr:hypothetical protein DFH28DRAFT_950767 [Melampsora americana]
MMESRSSTQFVHLQPATNGNTSIRRGSLPDRNLSSTTLNCSQTYFKGVSSHRRASSDAAGSTSLSCRAVLPALFLERKGPKPFIQTPMSPKALPICFTPLPPSIDRKIPEDKVHDPMFLELSHASRLCGVSRDQNCEGSSRSIYREESMIKNWLSRNPPGVAQSFSLQSIDDIKDDGEMCLPLDRMSLALFNFASTPNRSRISPSGKAALLSERNDENCRVVSRDSLSTLSISLDELLVEDEEVIPSKTNLHENNSPSSKSSTNPLMQDHGLHMNYASKPPFFASSNPGCGENPKSRSRLRDHVLAMNFFGGIVVKLRALIRKRRKMTKKNRLKEKKRQFRKPPTIRFRG